MNKILKKHLTLQGIVTDQTRLENFPNYVSFTRRDSTAL